MTSQRHQLFAAFATGFSMLLAPGCSAAPIEGDGDEPEPGAPTRPDSPGHGSPDDSPTEATGAPTTGGAGSTTDITTTSSGEETTGGGYCGDGVVGADEQCDDGEANGNTAYCTELCLLNICGDGLLLAGVESCDQGPANSNFYGSLCNAQCGPGKWCGDDVLQPDHEECDHGPDNGTPNGDDQGIACTDTCSQLAYRAFITSDAFTGDLRDQEDLDGLAGADRKCREAAAVAGLDEPDNFRAALSTGDVSLNMRFADKLGDTTPYISLGGQKLAGSFADLVTHGPGDAGITMTELGAPITYAFVASNTNQDGTSHSFEQSCSGWQSADKNALGHVGYNSLAANDPDWQTWKDEGWWLDAQTWTCDKTIFHLYCLE